MRQIFRSRWQELLPTLETHSVDLVCTDPPFGIGKIQRTHDYEYDDPDFEYFDMMRALFVELKRVVKPDGTIYLHLDYHNVHRIKLMMDEAFEPEIGFLNEIIWAYDYGGRTKFRWPTKHDNILMYAGNNYTFNYDAIDRIPYMAPGLFGAKQHPEGKTPTDVWWHTIVPTNSSERTGYPTQKPVGLYERMIKASSNPGELVLDPFAGSGTTVQAAINTAREFVACDENPDAFEVMHRRFINAEGITWRGL